MNRSAASDAGQPTGLFAGLRVVELGQYVAAPYCAELFAHGGADVVSVEPIAGSPTRHNSTIEPGEGVQHVSKARGKHSVAADLGTAEGRALVQDLCRSADVVISNLRPGAAAKLGVAPAQLLKSQPRIIVGEIDGFGDAGPNAGKACVDLVAQASSGLLMSNAPRPEQLANVDVLVCDYLAGVLLAFGISSALWHRDRTGQGQRVATSLVAAGLLAQHRTANIIDAVHGWKRELPDRLAAGTPFDEVFDWRRRQLGADPAFFYSVYRVADGWVAIAAIAAHGPKLLQLAGLDPARFEPPARWGGLAIGETTRRVADGLATWTVHDLTAELEAAGIPTSPVRFLEEALLDPAYEAAGMVEEFEHPRLGRFRMPAPPVRFSGATYRSATTTPALGEHTDAELQRLGYSAEVIERLVADGIVRRWGVDASRGGEVAVDR